MATPLKPWEKTTGDRSPPGTMSSPPNRTTIGTESTKVPGQPAVPPRPTSITTGVGNNGNYNSPYAMSRYYNPSYSSGPTYGGYGMYGGSGYGMYSGSGYGYRPYGMYGAGQEESGVFRQAEERTRTAFQSVESVVGAVSSISMMLESTYVAVHSCFRALIGVAEHFSRLRNHLWSIVSAISIIQRIRYLLRQLLHFLRLRTYSRVEETWDDMEVHSSASLSSQLQQQSAERLWPAIMFFTVIVGVPWLLWRLVTSISTDEANPNLWASDDQRLNSNSSTSCTARALYTFTAESNNELSINAGDELVVAPRQFQPNVPGWILVGRNKKSGIVPANYIEILPAERTSDSSAQATPSPALTLSDD